MRADSITLLLAAGFAAFAGCGGGGGTVSDAPNQPLENGTYQQPPSTYQQPPSSMDDASDYESPSGGDVCGSICSFFELAQCVSGGDDGDGEGGRGNGGGEVLSPSECHSSCAQAIGSYPCQGELVTVIDCLLNTADLTCDLLRRAQDGDINGMELDQLEACRSEVDTYDACQNPGKPDPMACMPPKACGACPDACTRCLCENPQDSENCAQFCLDSN